MPCLKMLSIAKTTLYVRMYVVSVVGEWNISMENLWNNIDREHKSIWIQNMSHNHSVHHKSHSDCDQTQASNVRGQPLTVKVLWISPVTRSKCQENRLVLTTFCFHKLKACI